MTWDTGRPTVIQRPDSGPRTNVENTVSAVLLGAVAYFAVPSERPEVMCQICDGTVSRVITLANHVDTHRDALALSSATLSDAPRKESGEEWWSPNLIVRKEIF